MKKYLYIIALVFLLAGCGECDESKGYHAQFKEGDMVRAKVDGKIGQVYYASFKEYKIRFESGKECVWLKEYEIEKAN